MSIEQNVQESDTTMLHKEQMPVTKKELILISSKNKPMNIATLNQKFKISKQVEFSKGKGGLPVATITNQYATAIVSLYGAQVLSYQPKGEKDFLWLSPESIYEEGKAIRGGIPVCFPWFGPHPTDTLLPQHGFARLLTWEVAATAVLENGAVQLRLQLHHSEATKALWSYAFSAGITVTVGAKLEVKLRVVNTDDTDFIFSDALHSYFNVSDISNIHIDGLRSSIYYEGFGLDAKTQDEPLLVIAKEENRRYVDHTADAIIYDKGFGRKIRVSKTGSKVTVVWNPWAETTKTMKDIPADGYKNFICVEAANAYADATNLAPGKEFSMSTTIGG